VNTTPWSQGTPQIHPADLALPPTQPIEISMPTGTVPVPPSHTRTVG